MKKSSRQISDKIRKLPIEGLTGFCKRASRKIGAYDFIQGFQFMLQNKQHSLSGWAIGISHCIGKSVSKQGLDKRLSSIDPDYFKELLNRVLRQNIKQLKSPTQTSALFKDFTEVLVEDSTCIKLPSNVFEEFPGPHNRFGRSATARIQLRMNLLKENYCSVELQSYRDNDQKHAGDIVKTLQAGQLVIRDLGYWGLDCFQAIADRKSFFLSRFKYGTHLRLVDHQEWMSITAFLKSQSKKGKQEIDCQVELGKSHSLKVRIVALKSPKKVIKQRKLKALKNRNKRANHDKAYFEFLNWTVLITNVGQDIWPQPKQLFEAYGFRWRIECVFKCWKSKLNLADFFKNHKHLNPNRVRISIYLILILISIFLLKWYLFFLKRAYEKNKKFISLFKFVDFTQYKMEQLLGKEKDLESLVDTVTYYCSYEVRKRKQYFEQLTFAT
ncbi:MAG: IS4 family transposase [Saprospiraceae bacterium]|nr:IS4 family transposase [Saprospiraceae bacterium]